MSTVIAISKANFRNGVRSAKRAGGRYNGDGTWTLPVDWDTLNGTQREGMIRVETARYAPPTARYASITEQMMVEDDGHCM